MLSKKQTAAPKGLNSYTFHPTARTLMTILGPDPLEEQIERALTMLDQGISPEKVESTQIDVKEERGRRRNGEIQAGRTENEEAAEHLAGELACMANTTGGGAIILGVADNGDRIGTSLDQSWLRHRIWQLTGDRLAVNVREADLTGVRLLVLSVPQSLEPIYYRGRLRWRIGSNCVEINPTMWLKEDLRRRAHDWSAEPSGHTVDDVDPLAVAFARIFMREGGNRTNLAQAPQDDLLRRLGLVNGDGRLTNAGALLFVKTPGDGLDYVRRDVAGGDSTYRVRGGSRPLVVQFYEVEKAGQAANRTIHILRGLVARQIPAIPYPAFREAIINGITHRDWFSAERTFVEHIGDRLIVTSPGGFLPHITPENIINHPPQPRYRSLAKAMARLGLAEDEGIGVDRMVIEMLAVGHSRPGFEETAGPAVKTMLFGGNPDEELIDFLSSLEPGEQSRDVDLLLVLDHLLSQRWVDSTTASSSTQRSAREAEGALSRIANVTVEGRPLIVPVKGALGDPSLAYRLVDTARVRLKHRLLQVDTPDNREAFILRWARSRERVSSTEVSDLAGVSVPSAGKMLTDLAERGLLVGSRPQKIGRGYHYLPTQESSSPM